MLLHPKGVLAGEILPCSGWEGRERALQSRAQHSSHDGAAPGLLGIGSEEKRGRVRRPNIQ